MKPLDKTLHLRESKRGPRLLKQIGSTFVIKDNYSFTTLGGGRINTNHVTKEHAMTHTSNIPHYIIDTSILARRLILLAALASSISACGVKLGSHVVMGTTSYLEEVNRGVHTENLKEHISANDRARLQTKLDTEVN